MADRDLDVVLFGATGFTGGLVAQYLADHAPAGCRWAIAGRNRDKLDAVLARLSKDSRKASTASSTEPAVLIADATDSASLQEVARRARVVISTVGPYVNYGEPLVAACATLGTDYVDLTGEPEFVDEMYLRHHKTAVSSGARLVHCCGFDSIPHDLGVLYTVNQLPDDKPIRIEGAVHADAAFSAGTFHSAITAFSHGKQTIAAARKRRQAQPRPTGRRARAVNGRIHRGSDGWLIPLPTIDPQVISHSAQALTSYGPDFSYSHFACIRRLAVGVGAAAGLGVLIAAIQIPPVRRAVLKRFPSGTGPSASKRARSSFDVTFTAWVSGQQTLTTRVSGGDPGYDETSKMLSESALCLAFDELPSTCGQVTTAVAMGTALIDRLTAAGLRFETL